LDEEAASRLVAERKRPSTEEVAREALVSRTTAYRHFSNVESLLVEAPIDAAVPDAEAVFAQTASEDPEERIDQAQASMHKVAYENEAMLRIMLANSISCRLESESVPRRQNRRTPLIETALAPARERFSDEVYERLCASLAMIFGTESMIVCQDALRLGAEEARAAKSWAARALARAALQDSRGD